MRFFYLLLLVACPVLLYSRDKDDQATEKIDSSVIFIKRRPVDVTTVELEKSDLQKNNSSLSVPFLLQSTPSAVATYQGGSPFGYTFLRIRGISGSHLNVNLNGIRLNDAESGEVFWVNIPAMQSLLGSVQVERGAGLNGFGANINLNTTYISPEPSLRSEINLGSYNTEFTSIGFNSGRFKRNFHLNFAYNTGKSDGYVYRSGSKVRSSIFNMSYLGSDNSFDFTWLFGQQKTGLAWDGISYEEMKKDRRTNNHGKYKNSEGVTYYYHDETDNYMQNHFQAKYIGRINPEWSCNVICNLSIGDGFYTEYKNKKSLSSFGIPDGSKGDFVINKAMSNYYYALNAEFKNKKAHRTSCMGAAYGLYDGEHFGYFTMSTILPESKIGIDNKLYFNRGVKHEYSVYLKNEFYYSKFWALLDVRYRGIKYGLNGLTLKQEDLKTFKSYNFFNLKAGLNYNILPSLQTYFNFAYVSKEPTRTDLKEYVISHNKRIKDNLPETGQGIKPEHMIDLESGIDYKTDKFKGNFNFYYMKYFDILVETGKLNDVGYHIRENIPDAYRTGMEISLQYKPSEIAEFTGNMCLSRNILKNYTANYESVDAGGKKKNKPMYMGDITMLKSPSITFFAAMELKPFYHAGTMKDLGFVLSSNYVGKQYWDNTQSSERFIPPYFLLNLSMSKTFMIGGMKSGMTFMINNLLNNLYYSDAWVDRSYDEKSAKWTQYEGLYPAPPINFMLKIYAEF